MNDSYAEWLVKRKNPAYNIVLKAALVLLCAISLVLALVTPFGIIILTVVGIASYFAFQSLSQEFEYLVVNDQITIDRVLGKARRKKGWEGSLAPAAKKTASPASAWTASIRPLRSSSDRFLATGPLSSPFSANTT